MTTPVKRWVFHDPHAIETWTVPINPAEMGSIHPEKNVSIRTSTALQGRALLFEGATPPANWEFSGKILHSAHYAELLRWSEKRNRIVITDHFGRKIEVYLLAFVPVPQRSRRKWKHDYTMKAVITKKPTAPTEVDA